MIEPGRIAADQLKREIKGLIHRWVKFDSVDPAVVIAALAEVSAEAGIAFHGKIKTLSLFDEIRSEIINS